MTIEEAIECLSERVSIGGTGDQNCMVGFGVNTDTLDEAFDMAISALRAQREALPPPCYQPDGDGCAYQIYGENNDEPIDRCKACPLCYTDKVRHQRAHNAPLTLDELREMDGEPVWVICDKGFEPLTLWALVEVCEESIFLTNNLGGRTEYAADVELEDDGITAYRQKPDCSHWQD